MATTLEKVDARMHRAPPHALSILLLASMLLIRSAEPQSPIYRFDLIHVDSNGNFTREELIHRALHRTFFREATLSATDSTASSTEYLDATADAEYSNFEYLLKLKIGTPPKPFLAVADTGSDVTWTKKKGLCDEKSSRSFTRMACSKDHQEQCIFRKIYGSKKLAAEGFMGNDMLTFPDKKVVIRIGCCTKCSDGDSRKLLPSTADGLVGLNQGPNSLLAKLRVPQFSYCLSGPQRRSQFWFGDGLTLTSRGESGATVHTMPLIKPDTLKPRIDDTSVRAYRYYLELRGISIGKEPMEPLVFKEEENKEPGVKGFELRSQTGNPIMFVDSGCSFSLLEEGVFNVLMKLLEKNGLTKPTLHDNFPTCFAGVADHNRPEMVLHFTGASMSLPWKSYMQKHDSLYCLTVLESKKRVSALGNFQQQDIRMLYDLDKSQLSFTRVEDCSKL